MCRKSLIEKAIFHLFQKVEQNYCRATTRARMGEGGWVRTPALSFLQTQTSLTKTHQWVQHKESLHGDSLFMELLLLFIYLLLVSNKTFICPDTLSFFLRTPNIDM